MYMLKLINHPRINKHVYSNLLSLYLSITSKQSSGTTVESYAIHHYTTLKQVIPYTYILVYICTRIYT